MVPVANGQLLGSGSACREAQQWKATDQAENHLADGEGRFLRTGQGHGDVSLCRFDGAAPTSGALQIAAVARNAALSEGRCHRPPGGPGEGTNPRSGAARNAGGNGRSLEKENRPEEEVDGVDDCSDRDVRLGLSLRLREAEEEEQAEAEKRRQLATNPAAPQINAMSDEELLAEMRRRAEAKQS